MDVGELPHIDDPWVDVATDALERVIQLHAEPWGTRLAAATAQLAIARQDGEVASLGVVWWIETLHPAVLQLLHRGLGLMSAGDNVTVGPRCGVYGHLRDLIGARIDSAMVTTVAGHVQLPDETVHA